MTDEEISWFASLQTFATIPTCIFGGFLGEYLGRRMVCYFISPLFLTGFLCICMAPDIYMLFFGRILGGLAIGLGSSPAGVYITEITTPAWRTTFGGGLSAFYMVGMVLVFTVGKWVHWRVLAGCCSVFPMLSMVLLFFIPESPSWLVTQGRLGEARKALQWLRGADYDISEEFAKLEQSFQVTRVSQDKAIEKGFIGKAKQFLSKLTRPDVFKPLILMTFLMFFQQFTGVSTITYYAVSIMENSGTSLDKYTATIIYGFIRLLSTFCGALLLRRFARRPLLIITSLCVALGMALLGMSAFLSKDKSEDEEITGFIGYLPLISVNIVAVSYQLGLGPICWSYAAELYPVDIRAALSGFSNCMVNLYIFLTIKTFPSMQSGLTPYGTYWFYSGIAVGAAIFGATLLPETKGKSLAEVSEYFYVCCTRGGEKGEGHEKVAILSDDAHDMTSDSFIYKEHKFEPDHPHASNGNVWMGKEREADLLRQSDDLLKVEMRFKRRSVELTDLEKSVKRKTLELSQLDTIIHQKEDELRHKEEMIRRRSAPIVQLEELDDLLLQTN